MEGVMEHSGLLVSVVEVAPRDTEQDRFLRDLDSLGIDAERLSGAEWFLGYDGNCPRCASIQEVVKETVGTLIVAISLHDPIVARWRTEAFGSNPPWAPTLFRVKDGKVEAWIGKKLAIRLATVVGPKHAWQLAEALAEMTAPQGIKAEDRPMARRSFVKGLAGVAAGLALLKTVDMEAEAASASACGLVAQGSPGSYVLRSSGVTGYNSYDCLVCPGGTYATEVYPGNLFYFSYYSWSSYAVWDPVDNYNNPYWFHSAGPTGCWVPGAWLG
jgi:hypothetical protein